MNFNEQLRQAYNAGKRQVLNEQGIGTRSPILRGGRYLVRGGRWVLGPAGQLIFLPLDVYTAITFARNTDWTGQNVVDPYGLTDQRIPSGKPGRGGGYFDPGLETIPRPGSREIKPGEQAPDAWNYPTTGPGG